MTRAARTGGSRIWEACAVAGCAGRDSRPAPWQVVQVSVPA